MPSYDLLLFDFDGTLADTLTSIHACMERTFLHFGAPPPTREAVRAAIGLGLDHTFHMLDPGLESDRIPQWITVYRELYRTSGQALVRLFDGAEGMLRQASAAGLALGVVSNKSAESLETALARLGIRDLLAIVSGDSPESRKKPDPGIYDEEVRPVFPHVLSERVLMVGDDLPDLAFARNAGLRSCWAAYGYGDPSRCAAFGPDHVIRSLAELAGILY